MALPRGGSVPDVQASKQASKRSACRKLVSSVLHRDVRPHRYVHIDPVTIRGLIRSTNEHWKLQAPCPSDANRSLPFPCSNGCFVLHDGNRVL